MKISIIQNISHSGALFPLLRTYLGKPGLPLASRIEKCPPPLTPTIPSPAAKKGKKIFNPPPYFWQGKNFPDKNKAWINVHDYLITEREEDEMIPFVGEKGIVARATHFFDLSGFLRQTAEGFLFLKVDDKLIHKLYPLFKSHGAIKPPYFHHIDRVGAHIPVMLEEETEKVPDTIAELGAKFSFQVTGCYEVVPAHWEGVKKAWVLTIDAPELQALREKYHLSPSLGANPFTLTIAIREGKTPKAQTTSFRINPAVYYG